MAALGSSLPFQCFYVYLGEDSKRVWQGGFLHLQVNDLASDDNVQPLLSVILAPEWLDVTFPVMISRNISEARVGQYQRHLRSEIQRCV